MSQSFITIFKKVCMCVHFYLFWFCLPFHWFVIKLANSLYLLSNQYFEEYMSGFITLKHDILWQKSLLFLIPAIFQMCHLLDGSICTCLVHKSSLWFSFNKKNLEAKPCYLQVFKWTRNWCNEIANSVIFTELEIAYSKELYLKPIPTKWAFQPFLKLL